MTGILLFFSLADNLFAIFSAYMQLYEIGPWTIIAVDSLSRVLLRIFSKTVQHSGPQIFEVWPKNAELKRGLLKVFYLVFGVHLGFKCLRLLLVRKPTS